MISGVKVCCESSVGSRDGVAFLDRSLFEELIDSVDEPNHSQSEGAVDDVKVSRVDRVSGKLDQVH